MNTTRRQPAGFTLLELILVIVVGALVMASFIPFLGQVFLRSRDPSSQLHDTLELRTAMENIATLHTGSLQALHELAGEEGRVMDDGIVLMANRFITFDSQQESDAPGEYGLLKITLRNALGETVTRLFSERR